MSVQQLRTAHEARPFRPFTLQSADGDSVEVRHPELMWITPGGRTIVVAVADEEIKIIDSLLITAIHLGNHRTRRKK